MKSRQLLEIWDLPTLNMMNTRASQGIPTRHGVPPQERETTRHCSYAGDVQQGIVLHSAQQRSTQFIQPGEPSQRFLAAWNAAQTDNERDGLVEQYFVKGESLQLTADDVVDQLLA
jgi:hypothetical protein